jgi:anti-sigma factor RsiW
MKITRDVIYDLLPAYFANEVSADTRALIEEFFATDQEFGRMAARFQTLLDDKRRHPQPETDAAREREAFDRARLAADLQVKARTAALVWAAAGLFALLVAFLTWNKLMGFFNPGVLLGVCFLAGAVVTFVSSFYVKPESRWRALVGLDDETLKSLGGKRR